jgi:hypothetical protein
MAHRSALTAALAGSPDGECGNNSCGVNTAGQNGCLPKPSSFEAFPCLDCASDGDSSSSNDVNGVYNSMDALHLGSVDIVGSAPTNTSAPGSGKQLVSWGHVACHLHVRTAVTCG